MPSGLAAAAREKIAQQDKSGLVFKTDFERCDRLFVYIDPPLEDVSSWGSMRPQSGRPLMPA